MNIGVHVSFLISFFLKYIEEWNCWIIWQFCFQFVENVAYCWIRKWHPTPVFLPGKSLGQRSLLSYSPWGGREQDSTKRLSAHTPCCFPQWLHCLHSHQQRKRVQKSCDFYGLISGRAQALFVAGRMLDFIASTKWGRIFSSENGEELSCSILFMHLYVSPLPEEFPCNITRQGHYFK